MRKWMAGGCVVAAMALGATAASAQMAAKGPMGSHSSTSAMAPHSAMASSHMASSHMASSHMASSRGHKTESKMDLMMVNQCHGMSRSRMLKDAECRDYMKYHPDWMKRR